MINDLTKGAPLKLMLLFSIPLLIGNIFQQFYNIADIIIVGRTLGMTALASVGAVSPLFFLIMFIIVLSGHVWAYYLYEIIVLNIVLMISMRRHEKMCQSFLNR